MRGLLTLPLFLCATLCYAQEKEPINRTWTSIAGTKVDAELVSYTDRDVVLKLKQGKTIKLDLNKLAEYDRYFLKGLEKAIVPEGGIKYHQLDDNFLDIIQGKKGNKEYYTTKIVLFLDGLDVALSTVGYMNVSKTQLMENLIKIHKLKAKQFQLISRMM